MSDGSVALKENELVVALAGNPNAGKTSLFNEMTGARQHVGNWSGVTVEKKEGKLKYKNTPVRVVDLPGTYSLGAHSEDEVIARDYIVKGNQDVIVNVVDATNLERNLYLTTQILEMDSNVVMALNMFDEAKGRKIQIDVNKLSQLLKIPVIPTVAPKKEGVQELIDKAVSVSSVREVKGFKIDYGKEVEKEITTMESVLSSYADIVGEYSLRWLAIKLLENDIELIDEMKKRKHDKIIAQVEESIKVITNVLGEEPEILIVDKRYAFISEIALKSVKKEQISVETTSDKIDRIVTHRVVGVPIFFAAMWAVFQLTFKISDPIIGWVEGLFEALGGVAGGALEAGGASEMLVSFVVDGVIGGVGSVLVFIPPIFAMFFFISLLEDSGYMARAAYVMDKVMTSIGLHGKSFIPMIIGFGCTVPGIMATRTLENKKDRFITILVSPFMSCGARLPVYVLFASALFTGNQGLVIFSIYMLGIFLAVVMGKIFSKYLFKGESSPFVMELPPYRIPTLKGVSIHMWERGSSYVKKAGTIILAVVVLIWALSAFPAGVEFASRESYVGQIGSVIAPIFKPLGFGSWQASVSLIFGILAKEVVVGTLAVIYSVEEAGLGDIVRQNFTPLSAYSFMVFTLIYFPCAAAVGAIKRETNSWKWTGFAVGYITVLAWIVTFMVYQGGKMLGIG